MDTDFIGGNGMKRLISYLIIFVLLIAVGFLPIYARSITVELETVTYTITVEKIPPNADNFWMPDMDKVEPNE